MMMAHGMGNLCREISDHSMIIHQPGHVLTLMDSKKIYFLSHLLIRT